MDSTKLSALLALAMLALSSSPLALAWEKAEPECHSCESGSPPSTGVPLPPISIPSVPLPPISIPSVPLPPVSIPSVPIPPVTQLPPVVGLPPVTLPPIPIIGGSPPKKGHRKACPPPPSPPTPTPTPTPSSDKCPIDALKLGACVDILGNEVHIGDANVKCCPLVKGIAGLSAAACLCTAIKAKVLDISVYVPIALEVLVNCGCEVPPGYKCT
ncbi:pEARLI1-like lipid transfer protein 1 [Zea mays]|uniref:PEARLI1-like lipid transfer protein 1 n=1 Tax=Zea mays TaxID=4577 RepID=A0A3L6FU02_MAIZE|nr:pEARLI1-like lipid transfer protein 1 [Zea mays]